jgi:hypothetical protein
MLSLQKFYNIFSGPEKPPPNETSPCGEDNLLFVEIARTFGLTFWLKDDFTDLLSTSTGSRDDTG